MISFSNLGKSYGDRTLFADVTMRLDAGHRYGLVGANGSGKSTLLHILAGEDAHTDGELIIPSSTRIGVLEQDRYLSDEQEILDVAMMGDVDVWGALADKQRLLDAVHPDAVAIAEVEERIAHADGYTLDARSAAILEGLGIAARLHRQPLSTLSGGFKLRVLLAQTLVAQPDLLLLDEPTNHLDILTIRWLEQFLATYPGCAVIASHDHRFLDNVTTDILDVDYETITTYKGNYSAFVVDKRVTRERKETEIERQQQQIAEKKAFIDRYRAKKTRARQAQSRLKQLDKIEIEELAVSSRRAPLFRFELQRPSGREVVTLESVDKAYDDNQVLKDVSFTIRRGERVAVIGANGLGKSTLLKIMVGRLAPSAGEVNWGYETKPGYFPQDHRELLDDPGTTALEYLWSTCPQEPTNFVRGQLGRVLFSGEDVDKKIASLSGGEAARLIFSRIIVEQPNVLVLDEPTNHLDLESIEALAEALQSYDGTVVLVSHDRWLVSQVATRVIELHEGGFRDYPGTYAEYLEHLGTDHLDVDTVLLEAKREQAEARAGRDDVTSDWEEQKRRRSELRKAQARRDKVTAEIEEAEARRAAIQESYCRPGFYEETPADELARLQRQDDQLKEAIDALMAEWEELETTLEELGEADG